MAVLRCEDLESLSSFEVKRGAIQEIQGQTWQSFALKLTSGEFTLNLSGDCLFCLDPENEIASLVRQLQELSEGRREQVLFEPAEPSFELSIVQSPDSGLKVEVWLDSGNAKSGIYRWDAAGVRFFTLKEHLVSFLQELKQEFAC